MSVSTFRLWGCGGRWLQPDSQSCDGFADESLHRSEQNHKGNDDTAELPGQILELEVDCPQAETREQTSDQRDTDNGFAREDSHQHTIKSCAAEREAIDKPPLDAKYHD